MSRISFTKLFAHANLFKVSRALLIISGVAAALVLGFGFNEVHCTEQCGSIVKFQYFHYRNLLLGFVAVQAFGWYIYLEEGEGSARWNTILSVILLLITAWVYGVVYQWDKLATFYFGHIAPVMNSFFLL